ncbi:MAG: hypothetical protein HS111_17570 [Kofleriaceae bacterium]|nr:hypothetical protein [Kofleriaceae bacterium]MCL4224272.1 hypothetical protein [Myxococcales bacterium]
MNRHAPDPMSRPAATATAGTTVVAAAARVAAATAIAALAAGCYGAAPPRPARIPLPELSSAATIDVHSQTRTTVENRMKEAWSCPAGHAEGSPACTRTTYEVAEPVTRTETTATYGAERISYGQFKVLTDPDYDAKLVRLDELRARCKGANVPRYVGMGLMLGGAAGWIFSAYGKVFAQVGTVALVGGGASYAFGYYGYGGKTCNQARALYRDLDVSEEAGWSSVYGADTAAEMKRLADEFNDRGARRGRTESLGFSD